MKKTMMLLLCLLIVVSLFATTALAAAITPRGSEGAAWTNKTIRQTSAIIAEGEKSDTGKADVYITKTDYPYNTTGMAVRIYDKTAEKKRLRGRPITTGQALQPISIQISLIIPGEQSAVTLIYSI